MTPALQPTGLRVALIAAVARNGAIGADNRLLWHDPRDQRHFRAVTMGSAVVMGRKTWDSLPTRFRPLPGRRNLVLSTDAGWTSPGAERFGSLEAALASLGEKSPTSSLASASLESPSPAAGSHTAFVIGGAQVYALAMPLASELVLTEIDADLDGDAFFPEWNRSDFDIVDRSEPATSPSGAAFRFVTYRRRFAPGRADRQSSNPSS